MELLVLKGARVELFVLDGLRVELLLVLEGVMVEILVLEGVRVELLVLGVRARLVILEGMRVELGCFCQTKTKITRPILFSFKIETRAVMTVMFLLHDLVQIGI